jgi:hypothetical protein
VIRRAAWNVQARLLAGADYGLVPAKRTQLFGFEEDVDAVIARAMEGFCSTSRENRNSNSTTALPPNSRTRVSRMRSLSTPGG